MFFKRFLYSLTFFLVSFSLFSYSQATEGPEESFLLSQGRPPIIQKRIDESFEKISSYKEGTPPWEFNGKKLYQPLGLNEHKILEDFIRGNLDQKEFYVLDIGGGDGSWGKSCVEFVNNQTERGALSVNLRVHIVSVGGEPYPDEVIKKENCLLYQYGQFKIENIDEEFKKRNIFQDIKFDFVITQMCFRHLVDPAGTFERVYNLLALNGLFFVDKFFVFCDTDVYSRYIDDHTCIPLNHIFSLFSATGSPFLIESHNAQSSLGKQNFLIKKASPELWKLSLYYASIEKKCLERSLNSAANSIVRFNNPSSPEKEIVIPYNLRDFVLYGDKELYKKLDEIDAWWVTPRGEKIRPKYSPIFWKNN